MTDLETVYAAGCDCGAFAVNTAGTDWGKGQLVSLVRTHLRNCSAPVDSIDIVALDEDGEGTGIADTVVAPGNGGREELADD